MPEEFSTPPRSPTTSPVTEPGHTARREQLLDLLGHGAALGFEGVDAQIGRRLAHQRANLRRRLGAEARVVEAGARHRHEQEDPGDDPDAPGAERLQRLDGVEVTDPLGGRGPNIANLAGVPSIVYGILGLALFVRALHMGRSVLAAALTLTVFIPLIISSGGNSGSQSSTSSDWASLSSSWRWSVRSCGPRPRAGDQDRFRAMPGLRWRCFRSRT